MGGVTDSAVVVMVAGAVGGAIVVMVDGASGGAVVVMVIDGPGGGCGTAVPSPKSTSTVTTTEFGCVLRTAKQTVVVTPKGAAVIWQDGTGALHDAGLMSVIVGMAGSKSEARLAIVILINSTPPTVEPVKVI